MLRLTQVTSRSPKRLSKHYELHNGELIKEPGGKMSEGTCSVREIADMAEFAELLSGLRTNEALIYGVPKGMDTAKIVRSAAYGNCQRTRGSPETSSQRCMDITL